jgi:exosortase
MTPSPARLRRLLWPFVRVAVPGAGLLWAYAPTLRGLAHRWAVDPQYSHGYLVPAFAALLLWLRRGRLKSNPLAERAESPARGASGPLSGLALLLGGTAVRLAGTYFYYDWFDGLSLLPCVAGLALLLGGWRALHWAWPAVAFLFFMVPLPYQAELALSHPLQRVATVASTYSLQTLGFPALAEGNVITLGATRVGVAEACSGLSMLFVFVALALALCLVLERPWWHRAVLLVSAVPIAVIANVLRITVTGVLYQTAGHGVADMVYHDLAGWLMMPIALALLWLELAFLKRLLVAVPVAVAPGPLLLTYDPGVAAAPRPLPPCAGGVPRRAGRRTEDFPPTPAQEMERCPLRTRT